MLSEFCLLPTSELYKPDCRFTTVQQILQGFKENFKKIIRVEQKKGNVAIKSTKNIMILQDQVNVSPQFYFGCQDDSKLTEKG